MGLYPKDFFALFVMTAVLIGLVLGLSGCTVARVVREDQQTHIKTTVSAFAIGYSGVQVVDPAAPSAPLVPSATPAVVSSRPYSPCDPCPGICVCGGTMSRTWGEAFSNLISAAGSAFAIYYGAIN